MDDVKQLIEPIDLGMISQNIRVGNRSANQTLEIMRPSRGVTDGALLRGILKVPPEKPGVVEKIASNRAYKCRYFIINCRLVRLCEPAACEVLLGDTPSSSKS